MVKWLNENSKTFYNLRYMWVIEKLTEGSEWDAYKYIIHFCWRNPIALKKIFNELTENL